MRNNQSLKFFIWFLFPTFFWMKHDLNRRVVVPCFVRSSLFLRVYFDFLEISFDFLNPLWHGYRRIATKQNSSFWDAELYGFRFSKLNLIYLGSYYFFTSEFALSFNLPSSYFGCPLIRLATTTRIAKLFWAFRPLTN